MYNEDPKYDLIDEALAPVSGFVRDIVNITGEMIDQETGQRMFVESMKVTTPIEMDVNIDDRGDAVLGSAPPTQTVETSFMPVFHHITLNISIEEDEK